MSKVFTTDSFFIFQHCFHIFPINKLDYHPFVMTSTIPWEGESVTTLNISSIHKYSRLLADVKNSILQIFITDAVWYAYNSTLFLQLNCSPFAWFFSKFIILFSNLLFTFFVVTSSLVSFLFSNEIWSMASVSLCIWLDSLCKKIYISSVVENGKYMNYQYNSEQMFIICSNRIKIKHS